MNRLVLTVDLKDDPAAIAEYCDYHRRVWPEVVDSLRAAGVERMDIHLLGRRLVMIIDLKDGSDYKPGSAAHAAGPRVAEWERLMKSLQERAPGAPIGEWWARMEPVFRFGQEPAVAHAADRADRS